MSTNAIVNHPNLLAGQLRIDVTDTTQFGVYSTGLVKKHQIGTRYRIGDRVFHYGHADGSAVKAGFGAQNNGIYRNIGGGVVSARVIGDMWVDILLDATEGAAEWFGTKNNMVGGMMVMAGNTIPSFRMITGHEKGANAATIKVYLDGPLVEATDAAKMIEMAQNPYNQLRNDGGTQHSVMGVAPMTGVDGSFGWFQSWGPCWCNPDLPVADTQYWRTVVFVEGGGIRSYNDASAEDGNQVAGFVIDQTSALADNPPFIFLQICP